MVRRRPFRVWRRTERPCSGRDPVFLLNAVELIEIEISFGNTFANATPFQLKDCTLDPQLAFVRLMPRPESVRDGCAVLARGTREHG